jgi:hypothetical protein
MNTSEQKSTRTSLVECTEQKRLDDARDLGIPWKKWGPYLSERQWGTVREDYSQDGNAWNYFSHDQARSRFDLDKWLDEHNAHPLIGSRHRDVRNAEWFHMLNSDIISMPDKWEYPWFASPMRVHGFRTRHCAAPSPAWGTDRFVPGTPPRVDKAHCSGGRVFLWVQGTSDSVGL